MILPYKGGRVYDIKMPKLSELTDAIVSTLFVILFWALSLGLNESTYVDTDLSKRLPAGNDVQCAFVNDFKAMEKSSYTSSDEAAREMLYGSFSARGASIAVIVLGVLALVLGVAKAGELKLCAGINLEIFNFVVSGAFLASILVVVETNNALLHQGNIPSANVADDILSLDGCKDDGEVIPNVLDRANKLRASLVFGLLATISIVYMARELREYMAPAKKKDDGEREALIGPNP